MTGGTVLFRAAIMFAMSTAVIVRTDTPADQQASPPPEADLGGDAGLIAWCAEGLAPINGGGCLALPVGDAKDAPLIVYLHGIYDRRADADELDRQRRVGRLATQRGFAVLAFRGVEGGCSTEPEFAKKFCWPSNERTAARGPEIVNNWKPSLRAAAVRGATGSRYVLGFSNGGFFAGLLAVRGWFDANAFAIGNAGPVEPVHALGAKPPVLLMSATGDASREGMMRFDEELTREQWIHERYSRAGGHELTDDEIETALTFFVRLRDKTED
jgi:dienelactone hydrolase